MRMILKKELHQLKSSQAQTLVEMMVVLLIFSLLLGSLYAILGAGQSSWETNRTKIELQQAVRSAQDWMINDLRQSGLSSISDVPADSAWYNQITFKKPDSVTAGSITWSATTTQFVLGGTGGTQLLRVDVDGTKIIALNIQTIQFRRQTTSPNILEISITAQSVSGKGLTVQYPLSFEIQIRNS